MPFPTWGRRCRASATWGCSWGRARSRGWPRCTPSSCPASPASKPSWTTWSRWRALRVSGYQRGAAPNTEGWHHPCCPVPPPSIPGASSGRGTCSVPMRVLPGDEHPRAGGGGGIWGDAVASPPGCAHGHSRRGTGATGTFPPLGHHQGGVPAHPHGGGGVHPAAPLRLQEEVLLAQRRGPDLLQVPQVAGGCCP